MKRTTVGASPVASEAAVPQRVVVKIALRRPCRSARRASQKVPSAPTAARPSRKLILPASRPNSRATNGRTNIGSICT
jgi:hypothetical protein